MIDKPLVAMVAFLSAGFGAAAVQCHRESERRTPPSFESASLEQCAQSEQVCHAVAERMGISITIPPWQAMVLAPVLDPR